MISLLLLGIAIFIVSVIKAGAKLHQDALRTLIHAPLRFFTNTDTGVVTNLFSQDLNLIDTELSQAMMNVLFCVSPTQKDSIRRLRFLCSSYLESLWSVIEEQSNMCLPGLSSNRASSGYAYILCVLGHQLPVSRCHIVYTAKVLFADFQTAEIARP